MCSVQLLERHFAIFSLQWSVIDWFFDTFHSVSNSGKLRCVCVCVSVGVLSSNSPKLNPSISLSLKVSTFFLFCVVLDSYISPSTTDNTTQWRHNVVHHLPQNHSTPAQLVHQYRLSHPRCTSTTFLLGHIYRSAVLAFYIEA